ncbi:ABC transporter ATP-binding protein [Paraburkholderia tagetis]|uniref:ABC transporter ATP-binding protein n=1 Tax=Paraburkholderia tagetis TaxID=2913261 RepID=A0A9X1RQX2_9BURK|nr:ABC transporter ATP-binding protein [Paraburkholderia tagetis]MCG5075615.1 ABC transporter ATP-binding protein [Paraburkholderia tagetis]
MTAEIAQGAPVLKVEHVSKQFRIYRSTADRLVEGLFKRQRHRLHKALDDVSFELRQGEAIGVLGQNGAGKSTLLKLVSGVLTPDAGSIARNGRITGLLELGTGFDGKLTGRQNIAVNARLIGMTGDEIEERFDSIVAFSELGEFIDAPVRTYSSGMVMRLGFAVAIHADPVCFIVDEALAVGDARFQQKCLKRIKEFRDRGGSILYVSHDINSVKLLCDRALLLAHGRIDYDGAPDQAAQNYYRHIAGVEAGSQRETPLHEGDYGALRTRIASVSMAGRHGAGTRFGSGEPVTIDVECESDQDASLTVGILVRDRFGQDVFGTNTALLEAPVRFERGSRAVCRFALPLNFAPGKYTLTVAIHSDETHVHDCQHWWDAAATFEIVGFLHSPFSGLCYVPVRFEQHAAMPASLSPAEEIYD